MFSQITAYAPWLIPLLAIGGVLGAGWKYVKLAWGRITSLVIINVELDGSMTFEAMIYFWENFKAMPVNPRKFTGAHIFVRSLRMGQLIAMEDLGGTGLLYWRGWRPIWVSTSSKKEKKDDEPNTEETITLTFFRWMFNLEKILEAICEGYNEYSRQSMREEKEKKINRFYVTTKSGCRGRLPGNDKPTERDEYAKEEAEGVSRRAKTRRPVGYSWDQLGEQPGENDPSPFEFLAYPDPVIRLVEDLEHWLSSQKWYLDRRIPWRHGVLATGPPGSGKSCLIRAVGEHLGIPVLFFDIASMTNEDFIRAWVSAVHQSPCIVAIEDADAVFNGRENVTAEKGSHTMALTFDCMLNRISGVARSDGVILFVTSNNAETLDPALYDTKMDEPSRPGRIDTRIILDGMDEDCRRRVAKVVLSDDLEYSEAVIEAGENDQPSQFHSRCAKLAQALYWARREGKSLDSVARKLVILKSGFSGDNGRNRIGAAFEGDHASK